MVWGTQGQPVTMAGVSFNKTVIIHVPNSPKRASYIGKKLDPAIVGPQKTINTKDF